METIKEIERTIQALQEGLNEVTKLTQQLTQKREAEPLYWQEERGQLLETLGARARQIEVLERALNMILGNESRRGDFRSWGMRQKELKSMAEELLQNFSTILPPQEMLDTDVLEIFTDLRLLTCLEDAGIRFIGSLVNQSEFQTLSIYNLGRKHLEVIKLALKKRGLYLGMSVGDWKPPT